VDLPQRAPVEILAAQVEAVVIDQEILGVQHAAPGRPNIEEAAGRARQRAHPGRDVGVGTFELGVGQQPHRDAAPRGRFDLLQDGQQQVGGAFGATRVLAVTLAAEVEPGQIHPARSASDDLGPHGGSVRNTGQVQLRVLGPALDQSERAGIFGGGGRDGAGKQHGRGGGEGERGHRQGPLLAWVRDGRVEDIGAQNSARRGRRRVRPTARGLPPGPHSVTMRGR